MSMRVAAVWAATFLIGVPAVGSAPVAVADSGTRGAGAVRAARTPTYTGDLIVRFAPGSAASVSSAARDRVLDAAAPAGVELTAVRRVGVDGTLVEGADPADITRVAAELNARHDVTYAEPDRIVRGRGTGTNDPLGERQWDLGAAPTGVSAPAAWPVSTGKGVTVAVIDSGIVTHPDLAGQVLAGYDFISAAADARDGDGRDANPRDEGDWQVAGECTDDEEAADSSWHGTHVAGTIAALAGNGVGVAGVAPGAKVLPVRVTGRCGGRFSDLLDAMTWAAGGTVAGVPANPTPARVLNLSLGGLGSCSPAMQAAVDAVARRGAVTVVAAGNEGIDAAEAAPGNCAGVVDVAASTTTGARALYSNYGTAVTVAAPGGDLEGSVWSTVDAGRRGSTGPSYAGMYGTSMAAPHVSAVAALVIAAAPGSSPAQVRSVLVSTASRSVSCTGCGGGVVDAARAVAAVTTTKSPTSTVTSAAPRPRVSRLPARVPATARTVASWAPFVGAVGTVRSEVRIRTVALDSRGRRTYGPWTVAARALTSGEMIIRGVPGGVYQYVVRGTDSRGVVSAWSAAGTTVIPTDVRATTGTRTGRWVPLTDGSAFSSTLLSTSTRGGSFTVVTPGADSVGLVVGTSRAGGRADVYVDGRLARSVTTYARAAAGGVVAADIPVRYGRHTVKVVARTGALRLDGIAFGR